MKYIIYITVNKVNGKIYVGVHKTNNPFQFDGYIGNGIWIRKNGGKFHSPQTAFQRAFNKYGDKSFTRHTIMVLESEEEAYNMEAEIVTEEFIKSGKSYNLSIGGYGGSQTTLRKEVHQYSLEGKYISSFNSISDAGKHMNKDNPKSGFSCISAVVTDKKPTAYGFQWSTKKTRFLKKAKTARQVHMFTLDGSFIKTWNSAHEVNAELQVTNIYNYARRKKKCAGYMWSFDMDYPKYKGRDIVSS